MDFNKVWFFFSNIQAAKDDTDNKTDLPGHNQSPLGNFALTSTRPYVKLNPMLERILAD